MIMLLVSGAIDIFLSVRAEMDVVQSWDSQTRHQPSSVFFPPLVDWDFFFFFFSKIEFDERSWRKFSPRKWNLGQPRVRSRLARWPPSAGSQADIVLHMQRLIGKQESVPDWPLVYSGLHEIHNGQFSSQSGHLLDLLANVQGLRTTFWIGRTLVQNRNWLKFVCGGLGWPVTDAHVFFQISFFFFFSGWGGGKSVFFSSTLQYAIIYPTTPFSFNIHPFIFVDVISRIVFCYPPRAQLLAQISVSLTAGRFIFGQQ